MMLRSFPLARFEGRRLLGHPLVAAAVAVVTLVPLLYGALYLWAFWDPYSHIKDLPVALVNEDRPARSGDTTISAGDDIVEKLLDGGVMRWETMSASEASAALREHRVYVALTVPRDFSAHLASADSSAPVPATLVATSDEADSMLTGQIASRVFTEVRDAAARTAERGYLDAMLLGFADARTGMSDAADGAQTLHDGLLDAKRGARRLSSGLTDAHTGSADLASGLRRLDSGAGALRKGAGAVSSGSATLAGRLGDASAGAAALDSGTTGLSSGLTALADGLSELVSASTQVRDGAAKAAEGAADLDAGVRAASAQVGEADTAASRLSDGASQTSAALIAYAEAHPEAASDPTFAAALAGSRQVAAGIDRLSTGLTAGSDGFARLTAGADALKTGTASLSTGLERFTAGVTASRDGARAAEAGAGQVAAGAGTLSRGMRSATAGAGTLASGAAAVSKGASSLATGAGAARTGSVALHSGLARLDSGAGTLDAGLGSAVTGSSDLATGLADGASHLPHDGAALRTTRLDVMSDPVALATVKRTSVANYGTGFAPYFIPLALWVGALMVFFLVQAVPARPLASNATDAAVAFAGFWPAALMGVAQASVLVLVVRVGLGLTPVLPLATWGLAVLAALTFVALMQCIVSALGPAGKLAAIALLMLQLTSAAGTFPIETAPGFFRTVNPYLPMTYVVRGLRQTIAGGDVTVIAQCALVLAAFLVAGLIGTVLTVRRRRMWTMDRLRPALTI